MQTVTVLYMLILSDAFQNGMHVQASSSGTQDLISEGGIYNNLSSS